MSDVYAAPQADLSGLARTETSLPALNGRIGRLQWLAYCVAGYLLVGLLEVGYGLVTTDPLQWKYFTWMQTGVLVLLIALVSRRRLHDLRLDAPFLLGAILPFINLYFFFMMVFKAGDQGANEYGQRWHQATTRRSCWPAWRLGWPCVASSQGLPSRRFRPGKTTGRAAARWPRPRRFGYHDRFASSSEPP